MPAVVLGTLLVVLSGLLAACSADSPDATGDGVTIELTSTAATALQGLLGLAALVGWRKTIGATQAPTGG